MKKNLVLAAVACAALLALGFGLRHKIPAGFSKDDASDPAAPTMVVELYEKKIHVADVGVGPKGVKLLSAPDKEIGYTISAALTELAARPFLPAMGEAAETGEGSTMEMNETRPGDAQYPWAVAGFLRERTGLRYEVRPYAKPR